MIRLMMERPDLPPALIAFDQAVVLVGRGGGDPVDWVLPYPDVSRVQCRFTSGAGVVFIEGLSERNPTYLSHQRLTAITRLAVGDEVRFGLCRLRLVGEAAKRPERADGVKQGGAARSVEPDRPSPPRAMEGQRPGGAARSVKDAPAKDAAAVEDIAPIVEQAQRWELRGQPEALLLAGERLRRGRRWLIGGRELGERGAQVRRFVEASQRQRWSVRRRAAQAVLLIAAAAIGGSTAASALLPDLRIPSADGGTREAPRCDALALARADELVALAEQEPADEAVVLGMAHALQVADRGRCRHLSRAEPALRGQLAARRARVLGEVVGPVTAVVARPDGRQVASVDAHGAVQVWDVLAQRASPPLGEGSGAVRLLDWSGDDRWLATGGQAPEVVIWDTKRWPQIDRRQTLSHGGEITALAFSADGSLLASADRRGALRLWDMGGDASGTKLGEVPGLPGAVEQLEFDESAKRLVARVGGQVWVWPIAPPGTPRRLGKAVKIAADAAVTALTMNLAGTQIVTGDREGQVFEWTADRGSWRPHAITNHGAEVVAVELVPTRRAVLSAAADRSLKLVELTARMRAGSAPLAHVLDALREPPRRLAVDPSGERALTVGAAEAPELWDIAARRGDPLASLAEQRSPVTAMASAAEQSAVVTGGADGKLRVWDLRVDGGSAGAHTLTDHRAAIDAVALNRQGQTLASAGRDGRLRVWSVDPEGVPSPLMVDDLQGRAIHQLAVSDDGRWVAASAGSLLIVWDTGDRTRRIERAEHGDEIRHLAFSRGGDWLVSADRGGDVLAWRMLAVGPEAAEPRRTSLGDRAGVTALAVSDETIAASLPTASGSGVLAWPLGEVGGTSAALWSHTSPVTTLQFDATGAVLASGSADGRVNAGVWRDGRFQPAYPTSLGEAVGAMAFVRGAEDEVFLAIGGASGTVAVYEPQVRGAKERRFVAHAGAISGIGFGASPRELLTAGRDGALLLWHLTPEGETKVALTGHVDAIVDLKIDASGRVAVTAGADEALRVWPLTVDGLVRVACRTAGRELLADEHARLMPTRAPGRLCSHDW